MDGWYYSQGGQSVGPVSLAELKQKVADGQVGRDDPVWHASLADWTAARKVPGLIAPVQQHAAGSAYPSAGAGSPYAAQEAAPEAAYYAQPQAALGYQGTSTGDVVATPRTLQFLQQTRPWVMLMAVIMFLGAALCALAGLMMFLGGSMFATGARAPMGGAFLAGMAIAYFVVAFVYFLLGFSLVKYFSSIGNLMARRNAVDLETAIGAQLQFWRILGISVITLIVLYLILMFVVVATFRP